MAVAGPLAVVVGVGCEWVLLVGSVVGVQLSVVGGVRRGWGEVRLSGAGVGSADAVAALGEGHESEMPEPGLRGGRARGKKVLTGIAVEVREPRGHRPHRMAPLMDAAVTALQAVRHRARRARGDGHPDGWARYRGLATRPDSAPIHQPESRPRARGGPRRACCPQCIGSPR